MKFYHATELPNAIKFLIYSPMIYRIEVCTQEEQRGKIRKKGKKSHKTFLSTQKIYFDSIKWENEQQRNFCHKQNSSNSNHSHSILWKKFAFRLIIWDIKGTVQKFHLKNQKSTNEKVAKIGRVYCKFCKLWFSTRSNLLLWKKNQQQWRRFDKFPSFEKNCDNQSWVEKFCVVFLKMISSSNFVRNLWSLSSSWISLTVLPLKLENSSASFHTICIW